MLLVSGYRRNRNGHYDSQLGAAPSLGAESTTTVDLHRAAEALDRDLALSRHADRP